MNVGFTGSRRGMTDLQKDTFRSLAALLSLKASAFIHGDCVGADADAHSLWPVWEQIQIRPCTLSQQRAFCSAKVVYPEKPPLHRNRDIVEDCHLLLACPSEKREVLRSGTWQTIRFARKQGREITIIWPDGSIG